MRSPSSLSYAVARMLVSVGAASCLSPTLPVPPPSAPEEITANATTGLVHLAANAHDAEPYAQISISDETTLQACTSSCSLSTGCGCITSQSVNANADGSWTAEVPGKSGDRLGIWQTVGATRSDTTEVTVP